MSENAGVEVTIKDLGTGKIEQRVVREDWLLITAGKVYVDGEQRFRNGTAVVTIKREAAR